MSVLHEGSEPPRHRGPVRAPQSLAGGLLLIALAALALWLTRDLDQGTLNAMGPAMLPRWLAIGVGLSGLALVVTAFLKDGDLLERWSLRGPVFVIGAILAFALTIRGYSFGSLVIPGLGLLVAGPLAIILGGFATPEARLRDLLILALSLTPFCMVLFGDLLNLPIPVFPQALTGLFPADWSQKAVLRATAAIMAAAAVVVFVATRRRRQASVDVAGHNGRI
ncbi:tripartite tricarboxylate transporter TctB family protein [Microvirga sp. VF16]|uniref:tripartite tricarboxylate transporter TctB family protein n=1 Tax=Microvirga sp. VF16 TaxID=2807101 RepID=UPI00193D0972|nr:tripartite tricarboxylate transporter TctB family protein [Microvirga sp. VF16]QRM28708.1 tripartite tricarboxylate transporter TctB family protein [Microvirga sp. VF16]